MNFRMELEPSFLEVQLFAITIDSFFSLCCCFCVCLFSGRACPLHPMVFISVANETEVVQAAASSPTCLRIRPSLYTKYVAHEGGISQSRQHCELR